MLTSASYIRTGATWPPRSESARTRAMETWWRYHNGDFRDLFPAPATAPDRLLANDFAWLSRKWRDLLFEEAPSLSAGGRAQAFVDAFGPLALDVSRQVVVDVVRYGVGVYFARPGGRLEAVDPRWWFPVVEPFDQNIRIADVLAYPYVADPQSGTNTPDRVRFHVLQDGSCRTLDFALAGTTIGAGGEVLRTRCSEASVVTVQTDDDTLFGASTYAAIAPYVAELMRRGSSVSHALDRNANPHLAVPEGSLTKDENGNVRIAQDGMALFVPDGGVMPAYVTWDAKFAEHREAIQRAADGILRVGALSPVLINPDSSTGAIPSGAALRRLAVLTVNRIRGLRRAFDGALPRVLRGMAENVSLAGGESIAVADVEVSWPTPLSSGPTDDADGYAALVGAGILDAARARAIIGESASAAGGSDAPEGR